VVGLAGPQGTGAVGLIDADGTLVPRLPDDLLADGGRGLFLVAHLALDVAVAARATGGSVVSVTLDLTRDPAPTSDVASSAGEPRPPGQRRHPPGSNASGTSPPPPSAPAPRRADPGRPTFPSAQG
jgi:hypothetical protein